MGALSTLELLGYIAAVATIIAAILSCLGTLPAFAALLPVPRTSGGNLSGYWIATFVHGSSPTKQVIEIWRVTQQILGGLSFTVEHYSNEPVLLGKYHGKGVLRGNKFACYWYSDNRHDFEVGSVVLRKKTYLEGNYLTWKESPPSHNYLTCKESPPSQDLAFGTVTTNEHGTVYPFTLKPFRLSWPVRIRRAFGGFIYRNYEEAKLSLERHNGST